MPQTRVRKTNVVRVFYCAEYVVAGYGFDTTRKAKWLADSLIAAPIPGIELVAPAFLMREQLLAVHAPDYVQAIETGQPRIWPSRKDFIGTPGCGRCSWRPLAGRWRRRLRRWKTGLLDPCPVGSTMRPMAMATGFAPSTASSSRRKRHWLPGPGRC